MRVLAHELVSGLGQVPEGPRAWGAHLEEPTGGGCTCPGSGSKRHCLPVYKEGQQAPGSVFFLPPFPPQPPRKRRKKPVSLTLLGDNESTG